MPTQLIIPLWQQVKGIPFLAFDAGGVLEMFDQTANEDAVILEPSISALYTKIKGEALSTLLLRLTAQHHLCFPLTVFRRNMKASHVHISFLTSVTCSKNSI